MVQVTKHRRKALFSSSSSSWSSSSSCSSCSWLSCSSCSSSSSSSSSWQMKIKIGMILLLVFIITIVLIGIPFHDITTDYSVLSLSSSSSSSSITTLSTLSTAPTPSIHTSTPITPPAAAVIVIESKNNNNNNNNNNKAAEAAEAAAAAVIPSLPSSSSSSKAKAKTKTTAISYRTPLAYGTKSLGTNTAQLVSKAIQTGFRHIVTCGHHSSNNESGVGIGIQQVLQQQKTNGGIKIERKDLFIQTCFVPFIGNKNDFQRQSLYDPPENELINISIEDQVHISIKTSLQNLNTSYIDAYIFHNFRAKIYNTNDIYKAWKIFEIYVNNGTIKNLGITSIHNNIWFNDFYNNSTINIKPTIIQNRYHSNRQYDAGPMQDIFHGSGGGGGGGNNSKYPNLQVQRFWVLNGSSSYGRNNKAMAISKNVTSEQLMLGFIMTQNETCLVGTKNIQHMIDDIKIMNCYSNLFSSENERIQYSKKLGMKQQPKDKQLPGSYNGGSGNEDCRRL